MNKPTEEDLILLYYGEHNDAELAMQVAQSPELKARMDALADELAVLDHMTPPPRDPNYGAEVWARISPNLESDETRTGWFERLQHYVTQPRLSLAGGLAVLAIAAVAFVMGQNFQAPIPAESGPATLALDGRAILAQQVLGHLSATDRFLTAHVNEEQQTQSEAAWAQELLLSNRLYRQAAGAAGHDRIVRVLEEIEPVLLEMANQATEPFGVDTDAGSKKGEQTLLFKVRASRTQLEESI